MEFVEFHTAGIGFRWYVVSQPGKYTVQIRRKVRVLVVWEPILATDRRPPTGSTLGRIADGRVRQFWDPKHAVSSELKDLVAQKSAQPKPDCCIQKGFYWDEPILYPAGAPRR
jgi:hypothetical protein